MKTDPHLNQIMQRFQLASNMQIVAHHYDLKAYKNDSEKSMFSMLAQMLTKEALEISTLGISELNTYIKT